MEKYMEVILDINTNQTIFRDYTNLEIEQLNVEKQQMTKIKIANDLVAAEKTALLAKLGITADEAKLLLS